MPMGNTILWDAFIEVAGVDLSDQCRRIEVPGGRDNRQDNNMGQEMQKFVSGPKRGTLSATFRQGYEYGGVHSLIQGLLDAGNVPFTVKVRPRKSLAAGPDNPTGVGSFIVGDYSAMAANWGELNDAVVTFQNAEGADFAWTGSTSA